MRKSVYLDSTIFSYLFDERESLKQFVDITKIWWNTQRSRYRLFISGETLAEINEGDYPNKNQVEKEAVKIEVLPQVIEVELAAKAYVESLLMPQKVEGDAIHLAFASVYEMDFLLTWNCNHLANANKKQHIKIINGRLGLKVPEIITPMQLFKEDNL